MKRVEWQITAVGPEGPYLSSWWGTRKEALAEVLRLNAEGLGCCVVRTKWSKESYVLRVELKDGSHEFFLAKEDPS